MKNPPRILVTSPVITRDERKLLEGLLDFAQAGSHHARWQIELNFGELDCCSIKPDLVDYGGFVDIIARPEQRRQVYRRSGPSVMIENILSPPATRPHPNIVTIFNDHRAEGRTAANFFLSRHFRSFGWYGDESPSDWSKDRRRGFTARLKNRGFVCAEFSGGIDGLPDWIRSLPKPCAVFAAYDMRARRLIEIAQREGFVVPRDLAVLGIDNDRIVCTTATPTISSIPNRMREIGYNAGRILNELMSGRSSGGRVIRVRHSQVVSRLSTDVDALVDSAVAEALRYVRNNLFSDTGIEVLAKHVGLSKSTLQERALRELRHPIGEEIRSIRLCAAKELLSETDRPITAVADICGYTSVSHLSLRIKEDCGMTPLAYRRRYRQFSLPFTTEESE